MLPFRANCSSTRFNLLLNADDDGEVFDLEDSEDFSCTSEDSSDAGRNKTNKRRKPLSLNAEEKSDTNTNENYDEDEVALQQAIALSMAGTVQAQSIYLSVWEIVRPSPLF